MILKEIDLTDISRMGNKELCVGPLYLCLIGGKMFTGHFTMEWYGLNFDGWYNPVGLQFDPPGTNSSQWERIWRLPKSHRTT